MCSEIMIMWNIYGSRMEEKRIEIWFSGKRIFLVIIKKVHLTNLDLHVFRRL
jgi:hypothetical protein